MSFEIDPNWLRHPIKSSQINEIAFDKSTNRLYVRFHNNSIYSYPYTLEEYQAFVDAPSAGKYFYANIKSNINGTKMKHAN